MDFQPYFHPQSFIMTKAAKLANDPLFEKVPNYKKTTAP